MNRTQNICVPFHQREQTIIFMPLESVSQVISKFVTPAIPSFCTKINNQFCSYSISFKIFISIIPYQLIGQTVQVLVIFLVIFGIRGPGFSTAMTFFVLQYSLRVIRTYFLFTHATRVSGILADATWAIFAFYLLLYLQSGHVSSKYHHFTEIVFGKLQFFHHIDRQIKGQKHYKIFKFTFLYKKFPKTPFLYYIFWNQKSMNYDIHYFVI